MSENKQLKPTKVALGYLRISDKKQIEGESKNNQKASIQKYADANGIKIIKWFYDEAKSGKNAEREELQNLLTTAVKMKGQIDYVIVYKMNRASRNIETYFTGIRTILSAKGIQIRSATEQFDDTPTGHFMEAMHILVSQLDNENKRETVIDNMRRIAQQGYWQHKPIRGFMMAKTKNSEGHERPTMKASAEAKQVTEILMRFNRGDITEAELCRYATSIKFLDLKGKQLSQEVIHKMIKRPEYAGFVHDSFTNFELVEGKHNGLISKDVYWQNQHILKSKNKDYMLGLKHSTINAMYPLRRFVKCVNCNLYMTACAPSDSPRYFCARPTCRGTGSMMADVVHAKFEKLLATIEPKTSTIRLMKEILKRQSVKELGNINQDKSELRDRLDNLATTRANAIKQFINGKITEEDKQTVIDDMDIEKLQIRQELSELEQRQTISESSIEYALNFMSNIAKQWSDASLDLKQKFQNLIFPEGFILDIKNDKFIINKISPLYRGITPEMEADYVKNSTMVTPRRVELLLPG